MGIIDVSNSLIHIRILLLFHSEVSLSSFLLTPNKVQPAECLEQDTLKCRANMLQQTYFVDEEGWWKMLEIVSALNQG